MLFRIGLALIAAGIVAGIASAVIWGWDGPDRGRTVEYRVVNEDGSAAGGEGNVVLLRDDEWDGPRFFPFFPVLIVGGVLVTIALVGRGRGGGWSGPRGRFDDWHREAHREDSAGSNPVAG